MAFYILKLFLKVNIFINLLPFKVFLKVRIISYLYPMLVAKTIEEMQLDGGIACLDFINSAFDTEKEIVVERLHTYHDLLILAKRLHLLKRDSLKTLTRLAGKQPAKAQQILLTARRVRKVMFKVFNALAHGSLEQLDPKFLQKFNKQITSALSTQAFMVKGTHLYMTWKNGQDNLMQPLQAFLLSAYELLINEDQRYIKQCGACEWLFIDKTKNHRRKWCDMQTCGSSEKSRRYYNRKKTIHAHLPTN